MWDLIIVGAGPAGITASVYAARKRINFLLITKDVGGQAAWSGEVANYTGYQLITGPELAIKFEEHLKKYPIQIREAEEVIEVRKIDERILVRTNKEKYEAKTAIIASGKSSRELDVPGEKEFKNKGLTYCATCDGPLFSGKAVAVIGGGNSALDAALQLDKISRQIYLINSSFAVDGDAMMLEKVRLSDKITILNNTKVSAILGDRMVDRIKIKPSNNLGQEKTLAVEGVFVEIGLISNSVFINVEKNKNQEIKIDCYNCTNIPGIFAAGDVSSVPEKQIIIAAGEGAKAALGAFRYLLRNK